MSEIRSFDQFKKKFTFFDEPEYYVYCFPKCADVQQCFNKDWKNLKETEQRKMLKELFNKNAHAESPNEYDEKCFENVRLVMFMRHKNIDQYTVDEIPNWQTLLSKMQIVKTNMMPGKRPMSYGGIWFDEYVEEMYNTVKKFLKPSTKSRNPFAKKGPVTTFAEYLESKKIKEGERNDKVDIGNSQDGISELAMPTAWGKRDIGNGWRYEKKLTRPTNWQAIDAEKLEYAKEFPNNSDVKELSSYKDFEELFPTEPEEEEETKVDDMNLEETQNAVPVIGTAPATAIATKVGTEEAPASEETKEEEEETKEEETKEENPAPAPAPAEKTGTGSSTKINFNLGSSSIASASGNRNAFASSNTDGSLFIDLIKLIFNIKGGNKSRRRNKKTRRRNGQRRRTTRR
jgi:hypothetical protein